MRDQGEVRDDEIDDELDDTDDELDGNAGTRATVGRGGRGAARRRRSAQVNRWSRTFHVYVSMGCMLVVAFFALTGLTLNHPTWSLGSTSTTTRQGTVPAGAIDGTNVDFLAISEYVRDAFGVNGKVKGYGADGANGHIDYAGPGYSASVTFSMTDASLTTTVTQGDLLAVLNDIHKGRDTSNRWSWAIDASAVLLLVITITGIAIQVFQRKRRRAALLTCAGLGVVTLVLLWLAAH